MAQWILVPMLLISGIVGIPQAAQAETDPLNLTVDAAIMIDAETGKILYSKNAEQPLAIASMTKMMTEYLLFEAIEEGRISWDQQYSVTDYTYKLSQNRALSNVPLRQDGTYSIRELYEAMAIYSANAATVAIAETIAGTEDNFVTLMNEKAEEMGLEGYTFVNSTGLNNADLMGMHPASTGANDENVMPAESVARLAFLLLRDYPEVLEAASIPKKTFREGTEDAIEMSNWNFMLPGLVYEYEGIDGLKTGTTELAGHSFTGTAERNGMRLITVVMKAVDAKGVGSYKARFDATRAMMDYGFAQFTKQEIVTPGQTIEGAETIAIDKGKEDEVGIAVKDGISMVIKSGEKELYTPVFTPETELLEAEVEKGQVVGKVKLQKTEGEDLGYILEKDAGVDVVTTAAVERASWISLVFQGIGAFFAGLWGNVTDFVGGLF
ncbi:D-alanyl-D-alanine carboxypeptidase [Chryseomicrobium excrementi]|uniref:serine-type D-Ala-D-Ala carboxypeptidase n=2 Tax=Chryseomicrobium excrementi TaxID=2041346 RepID=A0A2M9EWI9_9BACL|nr:serine hydrolase [Chryseomicrobium excrementi]PJK15572.1 D-alanyl-D-alanine carboxypeptidase [Chryseomicrobium excrementi]